MPQLMPLMWMMSGLIIFVLLLVLFNLYYWKINVLTIFKMNSFCKVYLFMW